MNILGIEINSKMRKRQRRLIEHAIKKAQANDGYMHILRVWDDFEPGKNQDHDFIFDKHGAIGLMVDRGYMIEYDKERRIYKLTEPGLKFKGFKYEEPKLSDRFPILFPVSIGVISALIVKIVDCRFPKKEDPTTRQDIRRIENTTIGVKHQVDSIISLPIFQPNNDSLKAIPKTKG
jgi:hypothetical protein